MALNDKDILITPNKGSGVNDPKIDFVGADASTSGTITVTALAANSGTVSFGGYRGPILQIINTGTVAVKVLNTGNSVSTTTGALQVVGGVGIQQDLYVGGLIYGNLANSSANVQVSNDNASTTPQYITFVSTSTGSTPLKVGAPNGLAFIPSSGFYSIGTANPRSPLVVRKDGTNINGNWYEVIRATNAAQTKGISLGYDNGSATGIVAADATTGATNLAFWTYDATIPLGWGERVRINSTGQLLVGTSNVPANSQVTGAFVGPIGYDGGVAVSNWNGGGAALTSYGGAGLQLYTFTGNIGSEVSTERLRVDANGYFFINTGAQLNTGFNNRLNVLGSIAVGTGTSVNGSIMLQSYTGVRGAYTNLGTEKTSGGPVLSYAAYPGNTASTFVSAITGAASARSALVLSDTIRFFTGASANIGQHQKVQTSEVLRVDNLGKVGIGTNAPGYQLEVFADSPNTIVASNASSGVTQEAGFGYSIDGSLLWTTLVDNGDSNKWKLRYNGTSEYLTVDTAGNVGVGTTAPSQILSVAGTLGISETGGTGGRLQITSTTAGAVIFQNDPSPIIFKTSSGTQEKMRITDGGRVGIGITTPNTNVSLDVLGSIQTGGSLTIGDGGYLTTGTIYSNTLYGMAFRAKTYYPSQAAFTFISGTGTEVLRIATYGNVGIGTSTASSRLTVTRPTEAQATQIELRNEGGITTGQYDGITWTQGLTGATNLGSIRLNYNTSGATDMAFNVRNNSNVIFIKDGGLVGINTTSPGSSLHVSGQSRISGTNARLTLEPAGGGTTNLFNIDNSSGTLRIFREDYAASGTGANGAVRLTIDNSGNVVINSGYLQTSNGLVDVSGTNSALRILSPGGASTATSASSLTGAIKIRLPQGYTDTMMRMTVKVYTYDGLAYEIALGGYNYSATPAWINTFAYMSTRSRGSLNVRFGHDGTYNCIFIGETSTIWAYPQVFVTDFQAGYNNYGLAQWNTGWNVGYYSGAAFANTAGGQYVTSTITVYPAWTTGSLTSLSQLINDVPYASAGGMTNDYVPKWDGAKFVNSQLYSTGTNVGVSTTSPQATLDINGITLHRNGSQDTGAGQTYQIRFGYNNTDTYQHYIRTRHNASTSTSNAFDFYTSDGTPAGTWASNKVLGMTINGGSVGVGNVTTPNYTLHVQGVGYSSTSFRTPIYYDHDNTAYYVDGNNTSILNTLLVSGGTFNGAATSGVTRSQLDSNGSFFSYYAAETSPRIQLGRDIGVSGGAGLALGGSTYALIGTNDTAGTNLYIRLATSVGGVTTTPQLTLTSTGLGLGTTSPGARLETQGADQNIIAREDGTSSAWRARILSKNSTADKSAFLGVYGSNPGVFAHNYALNGWAGLYVNTANGSTDGGNVILAGSGSVGIGTASPSYKLHVVGDLLASTEIRSPIFYDSDNPAFYVNPAGSSNLNSVTAASLSVSGSFSVTGDFSANRYLYSGATAVTSNSLGYDPTAALLWTGSPVMGDGINADLLAFTTPTTVEVSANGTTGWTSTPVTSAISDLFAGKNSMRHGANFNLTTSQLGVRFTWNGWGYKFWSGLLVSGGYNGDSVSVTMEGSTNGTTWTTLLAQTNIGGNWPGNNYVRQLGNNSGANPYLRVTIVKNNTNANAVGLNNISIVGNYGGFNRLFDWDVSRNLTHPASLYVQGTYYDNANSAWYVKPSSISRLNTLYVSDGNNGKILWDDYYHGIVLRGYPTNATTGIATADVVSFMEYSGDFRFYQHNGTVNNLLFQVTASSAIAYGDMRSPIFYNYTDTAYYVDPNAAISANFYGSVNAATYNLAGLRVNASGSTSAGAAFAIQQVTSEGWTGIFVDYEPYTGWGLYHDNPNNYFLITAESTAGNIGSNTVPSRVSGNRTAYTKFLFDQNTGDGYAGGSLRSPVYYNYTDTSYYIDANSTSRLYDLQVANYITNGPTVNGRIILYGNLHIDSFNGNDIYANYYSGRRFRTFYGSQSESLRTDTDGIVYIFTQLRTPFIYDYDNTGYYVDPAGTTRLNYLNANYLSLINQRGNSGTYPIGHYSSGDYVFEIDPTWTNSQLQAYFNSGNVSWVADSTAPGGYAIQIVGNVNVGGVYGSGFPYIPVETDDAFYCEVWIKSISGSNGHYMGSIDFDENFGSLGGNPGSYGYWTMSNNFPGGSWVKYTGYVTGFGVGGYGTFRTGTKYFTPQALFNYSGGGTSYISGWKITRIQNRGRRQVGVFPNSTTNTAEAWYGRASDRNQGTFTIQLGGNSASSRRFEVVDYNWTTVLGSIDSDGNSYASNSYRAPTFQDRDNTAYFLNPYGTDSYINGGTATGTWSFTYGGYAAFMYGQGNTASVAGIGLNVYSTGGNGAVMAFHRGGYYAVNMGLDSDNVFRIGGWSAGSNRLQLDMSSNLYLQGGVYSPIYYNYTDTAFYLDPNGQSRIGGIQISGPDSGTTGNGIRFYGIAGDAPGSYNHTAIIERQWRNGDESELLIFKGNDPDTGGIHDRLRLAATGRIVFHSTNSYGDVDSYISSAGTGNINGSGYVNGGEWYLPIIKDMDDPTYYLDPASTTFIKYLKVNTDGTSSASRALTIKQAGTSEYNFGSYPGAWTSALQIQDNSGSQFMWMSPLSSVGYGMIYHNTYPIFFYGEAAFAGAAYNGSLRSPIFYNYSDTGYYADFDSTSNSAMRVRGGTLYGPNPTWGEYLQVGGNGDNGTWAQVVTTNGNLHLDGRRGGYGIYLQWYNGGGVYVENRIDATIFYDRISTGYYLDAASYSNLNEGNWAGRMWYNNYLVSRNAGGLMGDYNVNGTSSKVIWTIGESWPLGNMYGIGYEYGSGYDHHLALRNNGSTYSRIGFAGGMFLSGTGIASGDWRAPIFYNYTNTGYYVDPDGDSRLNTELSNGIRFNSSAGDTVNGAPWYGVGYNNIGGPFGGNQVQLAGYYGVRIRGANGVFELESPNYGSGWAWTNYPFAVANQSRSTISYDYNDTGFYSDLNSDTNWQGLTNYGKMRIGLTGKGGSNFRRNDYTGDQNYWTGAMGWGYNTASTVSGWGNGFFDVWGVGTGDGWPPSTSHFEGIQAYHYTYGSGGYGWQLVNGGGAESLWFRPSWYGYGTWRSIAQYGVNSYSGSFYASIYYDSEDTSYYTDPNYISRMWRINATNYVYSSNEMYATTFYDTNDSSYYCDPNGNSQFSNARYNGWMRSQGAVGLYNDSYGNHFYQDSSNYWNMSNGGTSGGLRLRIGYGGSIAGYFYGDTSLNSGLLDRDGNWRLRTNSGYQELYNTTYTNDTYGYIWYRRDNSGYYLQPSGTSRLNEVQSDRTYGFSDIRSPIFYNYSDTGYYCDPNSQSQLSYVMANDWFRPQGGCGLYHNSYGHGLWAPESEGNPYGNWTTYTGGRNGWQGWGIQSQFTLMGRSSTDVGMHDSSWGWLWYQTYGGGTFMVGTSGNSGHRLYVNGAIYATGDVTAFSDRRVKKNIVTIDGALNKVLNLRGVYYERIMRPKDLEAIGENTLKLEGTDRQVGVIAQEVLEVVPELVTYDSHNDEYGVKYANTVGLLIEAIKELNNQVIELKQELAELKKD